MALFMDVRNTIMFLIPERRKGVVYKARTHTQIYNYCKIGYCTCSAACIPLEITSKQPSKLFMLMIKFYYSIIL